MGLRLAIASELLARLLAEARAAPAVEVCGLLFGDARSIVSAEPCRNVAKAAATRFEIDPAALFAAHRRMRSGGPRLIGHYHSHPGGRPEPSACDAASAAPDGSVWLVLGGGTAAAWRAVTAGTVHGRFDPLDLRVTDERS